jgi:hypothetical protein
MCCHFLFCKTGIIKEPVSGLLWELNETMCTKFLIQSLEYSKCSVNRGAASIQDAFVLVKKDVLLQVHTLEKDALFPWTDSGWYLVSYPGEQSTPLSLAIPPLGTTHKTKGWSSQSIDVSYSNYMQGGTSPLPSGFLPSTGPSWAAPSDCDPPSPMEVGGWLKTTVLCSADAHLDELQREQRQGDKMNFPFLSLLPANHASCFSRASLT